jgi:hypothetical protein
VESARADSALSARFVGFVVDFFPDENISLL